MDELEKMDKMKKMKKMKKSEDISKRKGHLKIFFLQNDVDTTAHVGTTPHLDLAGHLSTTADDDKTDIGDTTAN